MSRRRSKKRAGPRAAKDAKREEARQKRQEQAARTKSIEPFAVNTGNGRTFEVKDTTDCRMLIKAIDKGWIKEALEIGPATMLKILKDDNRSDRARSISSRELRGYISQLLEAEKEEKSTQQQPSQAVNVNVGVGVQIQVNESDDWYGSRPNKLHSDHGENGNGFFAAGNGAPMPDSVVAGSIQGGSVRPAVGQNGVGTNGHSKGPRDLPGPATGSG